MVVISESMAPAFHRGDIIFLWNRSKLVNVGDIPVVWFRSQPLPMVHRAVQVFGEGVVYVSLYFPSRLALFGGLDEGWLFGNYSKANGLGNIF